MHDSYTIMKRRNWFGTSCRRWFPVVDNDGPSFELLIAESASDAVKLCKELSSGVYYLAHNEAGGPDYGYVMPGGRVRLVA